MSGTKPKNFESFNFEELSATSLLPVIDIFSQSEAPRSLNPPQIPAPPAPPRPIYRKPQFQDHAISGIQNLYKAYSDKRRLDYQKKRQKQKMSALAHLFNFKSVIFIFLLLFTWKFGPVFFEKAVHFKGRQSKAIEKNIETNRHLKIDLDASSRHIQNSKNP